MKTRGTEVQDMKLHNYTHLIFDKGAKKTASSTNVVGKMVIHMQETETRSMFITLY
jgi:hypothetical protein